MVYCYMFYLIKEKKMEKRRSHRHDVFLRDYIAPEVHVVMLEANNAFLQISNPEGFNNEEIEW